MTEAPLDAERKPVASAALSWQDVIDHLACGIVVYDAADRLVLCNAEFRRLYEPVADALVPGMTFEDILRRVIAAGLVPEAAGQEEAWLQQRVAAHRQPGGPIVRRMENGTWRRIIDSRLADGSMLSFSIDVTELVLQQERLEQAIEAARLAGQRLDDAIEALPAGFELWDAEDRLITCNSEVRRMYPAVAALLKPGATWESIVRANYSAGALMAAEADIEAYVARRRGARREPASQLVHGTADGRWYSITEHATRDGGRVAVRMNITELRQQRAAAEAAQAAAERAGARLADAIESLPDGFALFDADDRLAIFNRRYREHYADFAPVVQPGMRFEDILRFGLEQQFFPQAIGHEEAWLTGRLQRHRHPTGPELQQLPGNQWIRVDERRTSEGGVAGVRTDVTELVQREQQLVALNASLAEARAELERLSETDALTGIANRRQFDRRLAEEWARSARHGSELALLLVDIDHFKRYNDHYGHPRGDDCLREVAQLLAGCARRTSDLVARYGGEEFALLLPHTATDAATTLAMQALAAVDRAGIEHRANPDRGTVTLSIGIAVAPHAGVDSADALVAAADAALYRAKAAGRHRAVCATSAA